MKIADVPTDRLRDMDRRYVERGLRDGGPFALREIRVELRRRLPSVFDARELVARIVELSRASPAGRSASATTTACRSYLRWWSMPARTVTIATLPPE